MNASEAAHDICFEQRFRESRGIFFGENPFTSHTPLLLAQLTLCALLTAILHRCLAPLGQSNFVAQILVVQRFVFSFLLLAGVILGPSVLGRNVQFRELLFPSSSFYTIDTFAFFGVMFFFFIIGVKTDLSLIRTSGKKAVAIGICTFSLPLLLNMTIGKMITRIVPLEHSLHVSIVWIGSFQAISSFHVIICLLADLKLMNSEIGKVAISSSMISGVCSLIWTIVVFTAKQSSRSKRHTLVLMLLFLAIMVIFAVCVFRPLVLWMSKRNTSHANSVKESHLCAIFILVLVSSLYGEYFGQHYIFGPIILGMVIPDGPPLGSALVSKLECFVTSIILPIFFVVSATRIDFSSISWRNLAIIEGLAFSALLWKVVGAVLPSLWSRMAITDALHLGLILSNQGIMEVLILERAKAIDLIDNESYTIMMLSIFTLTSILSPVVKFTYKPYKRYMTGQRMNIQHAVPNSEIRMLACLHYQEHTPSILNLFEASHPNPQSPICFYVVHLIELAGRSAPLLISHHQNNQQEPSISNESEHMINALRFFEHENRGHATVFPFTSVSPYSSMHVDVCSLAAEKRVSLVILLFHKHPVVVASEKDAKAIRTVNLNIIEESPCSVAILVDRGALPCTAARYSPPELYRVGVVFLSGPDDREALAYARMMAKHPNVRLTLIRFADENVGNGNGNGYSRDLEMDFYALNDYKEAQMANKQCFYQEEKVKDSMGIINVIRTMDGCFDLILVGRRHDDDSLLLAGLDDWNEFPELGIVGDMLVSMDSHSKASVLVVQQASSGSENHFDFRQDSHGVINMQWNDSNNNCNNRIWYPHRGGTQIV